MSCKPCADMPVMRSRVTVQRPGGTPDAAGHVDLSSDSNWSAAGSRSCKVTTRGGSEGYRFNQVQADISHIVEMRSDSLTRSIHPKWRLVLSGRVLDIRAAFDVDEAKQIVRCDCVEQV